jgi:hypothetical protein
MMAFLRDEIPEALARQRLGLAETVPAGTPQASAVTS